MDKLTTKFDKIMTEKHLFKIFLNENSPEKY
jgi:hypothetical protein